MKRVVFNSNLVKSPAVLALFFTATFTPARAQDTAPAPTPPKDVALPTASGEAKPIEKAAAPPAEKPEEITHEAQANLAAFFAAGNVSSLTGKLGGYYQLRAFMHGVRVEGGGGITGQATDPDGDPSNNFQVPLDKNINTLLSGKLRYDFFFTNENSAYTSIYGLHDSAANLASRFRAELGYRRFIFNEKKHALSAELGAVYTVDQAPFDGDTNGDGESNLDDEVRFEENGGSVGARLLLSYTNALSDNLAFTQTLELIPNIWPELEAPYEQARVDAGGDNLVGIGEATTFVSTTAVTLAFSQNLAIGVNLGFVYDNAAISRRNAYTNYDVMTSAVLAYKFF